MPVRDSRYAQTPYLYAGTTLGSVAAGTVIAPPSDGSRIRMDYLSYWLVDPSTSGTVTLSLGTVALPAVGLSSSRSAFSFDGHTFDQEAGCTVAITGAGSVGFFGRYVIATDD